MQATNNWSETTAQTDWASIADCIIFQLMHEQATFDLEDFCSKARQKLMPPREISKFASKAIREFVQSGYLEKIENGYKKR